MARSASSAPGFEQGLFATWRDDRDFVLNDERYAGASIIVAGPAFGVGSSREHAVWAIQQYGFDAVVAPSFSDIFRNNCAKNGLVPVVVPEAVVERIWAAIDDDPATEITVDVERLVVEVPAIGLAEPFPMDPSTQDRFLAASTTSASRCPRRRDRRLRGQAAELADDDLTRGIPSAGIAVRSAASSEPVLSVGGLGDLFAAAGRLRRRGLDGCGGTREAAGRRVAAGVGGLERPRPPAVLERRRCR